MFFLTKIRENCYVSKFTFYCFCCILVNFWAIFAHFTILEFSKSYLWNGTQYVWFKHVKKFYGTKIYGKFFMQQTLLSVRGIRKKSPSDMKMGLMGRILSFSRLFIETCVNLLPPSVYNRGWVRQDSWGNVVKVRPWGYNLATFWITVIN